MSKIDSNIEQANKIGNLFNSWARIIIIFENEKNIIIEKNDRIKQEQVGRERSDKRYESLMETGKELKDFIKYQQAEIVRLKEKQEHMEGYIKGKEYHEKK